MATVPTEPLLDTETVIDGEPNVIGVEHLPRTNITSDFQLNLNNELHRRGDRTIFDIALGPVRVDGLVKTYRTSGLDKPADGQITAIEPSRLSDGETFTIPDGSTTKTFEFDDDASVTPGNVAVDISSATTVEDVVTAMRTAINGAGMNLNAEFAHTKPTYLGGGVVGGVLNIFNTDTSITTAANRDAQNVGITDTVEDEGFVHRGMEGARLTKAIGHINCVKAAQLVDGETISIPSVGANPAETYEFDDDASVGAGNVAIDISSATDEEDVADAIVTAINTTGPSALVDARKVITKAKGMIVALHPSQLSDGETFTIDDGVNSKTFEFDDDASVTSGNRAVDISSATTMQDVRAAILAALAAAVAATEIDVTTSNPGFGAEIYIESDELTSDADTGEIVNTVANVRFRTEPMTGYKVQVELVAKSGGTAHNVTVTETVADADFSVSGLSGGVGAGWDVTSGKLGMAGRLLELSDIPRMEAVVGVPSWLVVRVVDKVLTYDTDPDRIAFEVKGITGGAKRYGNKIEQTVTMLIKSASATPYVLSGLERDVFEEKIAEFDDTTGTTIVADTELPVRVTRFGYFLEPSPVTTRVAKTGDTMSGKLGITVTSGEGLEVTGGSAAYAAAIASGSENGFSGESAHAGGAGVVGEGTANEANGVKGVGFAAARPNGGAGGTFEGCPAAIFERTNGDYEHLYVVPDGDSGSLPGAAPDGALAVPSAGTYAHRWFTRENGVWHKLRPAALAEIDNVESGTPSDRDILEYKTSATEWQRRASKQAAVLHKSIEDAHVVLTDATASDLQKDETEGEHTRTYTGTGASAAVELTWFVEPPPGLKSVGNESKPFVQVHLKGSNTAIRWQIEINDMTQAAETGLPALNAIGGTAGSWLAKAINESQVGGTYPNTSDFRGKMMVKLLLDTFNSETIEVGDLRVFFRDCDPFGAAPYDP